MSANPRQRVRRRRGIIVTDAVIGLAVVGALLAILAIVVGQDMRVRRAADQHRELTFQAEAALVALRHGQPIDTPTEQGRGVSVTLKALQDIEAPAGYSWVSVQAADDNQSVEVMGLVPAERAGVSDE